MFVYLSTLLTLTPRIMKRFKIERENGIRSLSVWSHMLEEAKVESNELKQFMLRMALRSIAKPA
ncbi:LOW QUALITY PROTEIN: hypothetical protein PHMEG_0005965 [Phytophthora megakarya]|uniref:Uncharacterized protein n=1 Tax=Phytophthora megakarya TaxID=4795 RepID=A0A225WS13_9STRA|nr:LOW QUALITY PROTEIN: hypothetical protein PHMEG_0005965 [Phytophthora megakarya]